MTPTLQGYPGQPGGFGPNGPKVPTRSVVCVGVCVIEILLSGAFCVSH